ncbi:unnamed protein product [Mytilus coruscus]|uniref:Endonuclease/exonuclease/phosphatase domain-containing protein n=1 Tax=Mytilus coruscus TaxID=42192 RepID=A0A6J8C072_MYTCO|nr:unnamed protein product [Mytilus coruscus]
MNTVKIVLTTTILTLFLSNCVKLDLIVNCKTVSSNRNIKENKEAPDKSWSITISNQKTSYIYTNHNTGTDLDLDTNCENVWAKISYEGNKSLYLCTYYRPPSDKGESLEQLGISLNRVLCKKTNPNILVSGDFNLGHIDWNTPAVIPCKPDASLHQQLIDILNNHNLTQVVNKNTRNDTTLGLLCMTNSSFVNRVETLPPIGASDHDIVYSEISTASK